jgi:hypothetical protein
MEDFLNEKLFPIIDPELAQLCVISLSGIDAETRQEESVRLQQDMPIHYDYDSVMNEVQKQPVGSHLGGAIPFNEHYRMVLDTYVDMGKISGDLMDSPASMVDPLLRYRRDQFWFQNIQTMMDLNPASVMAYYATRKNSYQMLKMLVKDFLDEDELK